MRDPNDTIAYGNVLEYIRDNQLMSSRKAKLIWAWIRDQDAASSSRLFVYDPNLRWYSLPGELIGGGDV
ncbi:hypothetical protein BOX15_Mlig017405g1 [Macrostomum lignano]|nr:hypothetical protein BOX15_Mlig017405g1 [Macrostomum lignano]